MHFLRLLVCASLLATSFAVLADSSEDPFDVYAKSLERNTRYNVKALIRQREPMSDGWATVQVERDNRGRVHMVVSQPLQMQGIESVDDGDRWQTYLPDEHKVVEDDSPLKFPSDDKKRLALCRKNYKFSFDGDAVVAGRRAYRLLARPRHSDLTLHRFYLDRKTYYPLKSETVVDGDERVEFETLNVSYPDSVEEEHFKMHPPPGTRWEKYNRPTECPSAEQAEKELGFKPVIPKHLPMGFELIEMQFNDSSKWRSLKLRLTDGLARVTIYEYREGSDSVRAMENSSSATVRGVQILVVSDIDEQFRQQLLESFDKDSEEGSSDQPLLAGLQWAHLRG